MPERPLHPLRRTDGRYTVDVAYRCHVESGEFRLDAGEKLDAAWVALGEMPELAFDGEREALAVLREGSP